VAGTSAKALAAITTIYQKQAATNLQSTGTWTKVTQAAAATYALGSGANGDKAAIVAITIHAEDLDGDNGFDCCAPAWRTSAPARPSAPCSTSWLVRATPRWRARSSTKPCAFES
jgi:hypothetical protein